ncbi:hypothetical protein [Streptomyces sp. NPDC051214]|uniref:hypothetical protein n=1 Tax=Streptomyces sp. NPDC051214 TaxID=3155282 RepID=UPI0034372CF6
MNTAAATTKAGLLGEHFTDEDDLVVRAVTGARGDAAAGPGQQEGRRRREEEPGAA